MVEKQGEGTHRLAQWDVGPQDAVRSLEVKDHEIVSQTRTKEQAGHEEKVAAFRSHTVVKQSCREILKRKFKEMGDLG
jgi:hypothetical protein